MPIYEYVADACANRPPCSRRKSYLQRLTDSPLTTCRECGVSIRRVMSSFAAPSGPSGLSSPDLTPLNVTGISAPSSDPSSFQTEGGSCEHGQGDA
jgi:putative FmdB family regulatory protein